MIAETAVFFALFLQGSQPNKGGRLQQYRQQIKARASDMAKKAAKKVAKAGMKAAGDSAGVGNVAKNIENLRKIRKAPLSKKGIKAGFDTARDATNTAAADAAAVAGVPPIITKKALEIVESKKFWRNVLIIVISLLLLLFMAGDDNIQQQSQQQQGQQNQTNPLQVTKTGPTQAKKNGTLTYTITVSYPGGASDAAVLDTIPPGTSYVSSKPQGTFDGSSVSWDIKQPGNPINLTFSLTLKAPAQDKYIINYATANLTGGVLATANNGGNTSPNHNNCGGKYPSLSNPIGNFGDPTCTFTKGQLYNLIKQQDPQHLHIWYGIIIPIETGGTFDPNSYNPTSSSGNGAYGLYQMNPAGIGFDNGSVPWESQTQNAIQYNNTVLIPKGCDFRYWQSAIDSHVSKDSC